ncbi:MAG: ABC transporter substrate-binding protein [Gammaproteobacteria bacterium]
MRFTARLFLLVLTVCAAPAQAETQPIDVLREHVQSGIAVLKDTAYTGAEQAQQQRLCAIAHGMIDAAMFSRLVLGGHWQRFSAAERDEFVDVFGEFLCRYYLGRLQARYSNEQVSFIGQTFTTENRAVVTASVVWQDIKLPIKVRMLRREGRWRAYDMVVTGISAVMLYRAQFEALLLRSSPAAIIDDLRRRIAEQG